MYECKMCTHREVCRYHAMLYGAITSDTFTVRISTFPGKIAIHHDCEFYDWDYEWEAEKGGDQQ